MLGKSLASQPEGLRESYKESRRKNVDCFVLLILLLLFSRTDGNGLAQQLE